MNGAELDEYIERLVDDAPPLSDAQISRLRSILAPAVALALAEASAALDLAI